MYDVYVPLLEHSGFSHIITGMLAGQSVAIQLLESLKQ